MTGSSGRGRLAFVVMLLLLAVAALAGWRYFQGQPPNPAVQVSQSDAQSGRSKAAALAGAAAEEQLRRSLERVRTSRYDIRSHR